MTWWLAYRDGATRCVFIVEAGSLILARMRAALAADVDEHFAEGHALPDDVASRVPPDQVGKLLSAGEAGRVLQSERASFPLVASQLSKVLPGALSVDSLPLLATKIV